MKFNLNLNNLSEIKDTVDKFRKGDTDFLADIANHEDRLKEEGKAVELDTTDESLEADLGELQKKATLWKVLVFVSFACTFVCMFLSFTIGVVIGVIGLMIAGTRSAKASKAVKKLAGDGILQKALSDVFDDVAYYPFDRISKTEIDSADFGFQYDKIRGDDYIQAKYKGLNIKMSDIELITEYTDSDGETHENYVFRGLWMICDFNKELSADVRVCERSKLGQALSKGGIKTENEAFNKQFNIRSKDAEEAFYILTPHMMEYIIEMDKKANARTNLSFLRGGKVHVALNSNRNAFEVKGATSDVKKIREQFVSEIRQVTDLIDELRITDSVFK